MTQSTCPRCQSVLPTGRQASDCPVCLIQQAVNHDAQAVDTGFAATLATGGTTSAPAVADVAAHFPLLEILDVVGQGGMGTVFRARQKALNRIVALKILAQNLADQTGFAERFQREAQTLAQLNHPNIVTVHEAGKNGPFYYLLMEYVEGTDLRSAMRTQALAPTQALEVVQHICSALQYAHEQGIVHRDIKPENVLLDKTGKVKIADFGLAKLLRSESGERSLTHTNQVMGTLHYMAPEQLEKPTAVDHRADIYSLGVVFYELLTGHLPVGRFKPPSTDSGVDARLDEVVLRALEREPDERYQSANQVGSEVQRINSSWSVQRTAAQLAPEAAIPTRPAKPTYDAPVKPPTLAARHPILTKLNPSPLVLGFVMAGLGIFLLVHSGLDQGVMTWIGLGLTLGALGPIAGSFKADDRIKSLVPNTGPVISGIAYIGIGVAMLILERVNTGLFTWIGIGIVMAGGAIMCSSWSNPERTLPIGSPRPEILVMSLGMLIVGTVILIVGRGFDPGLMTWIGLGLYLGGASMMIGGWMADEGKANR